MDPGFLDPTEEVVEGKIVALIAGGALALSCATCGIVVAAANDSGDDKPSASSSPSTAPSAPSSAQSAPPSKSGPVTVASGATVSVKAGYMGQVQTNVTVAGAGVWKSNNQFITPKKGEFYAINVTIEVTDGTSYAPGPEDFKLVAADGTVFNAEWVTTADDQLDRTEIYPGQKKQGKIMFDAPVGVQNGAKIQFEGAGKPQIYWTL